MISSKLVKFLKRTINFNLIKKPIINISSIRVLLEGKVSKTFGFENIIRYLSEIDSNKKNFHVIFQLELI
jgi:hypothetical protein